MGSTRLIPLGVPHPAGNFISNLDNSSNTGVIMRVILRASVFALASSLIVPGTPIAQTATTAAPAGPVKIGYINSAQLLQEAPGRAEAEAQFDREVGAYRQQLQRMNDSLNTLMAAFDREAPKLDTTTRAARGKAIRDRETEYQTRARGLDSTMQARQGGGGEA